MRSGSTLAHSCLLLLVLLAGSACAEDGSGLNLPPVEPAPGEGASLSQGISVLVRSVVVEGNTVLVASDFEPVLARYLGRRLGTTDLTSLATELTALYVQRGFVASRVTLPDQQVANGVIRLRAVEGRLGEISIDAAGRLRPAYVRARLARPDSEVLHLDGLSEMLRRLRADPMIADISAVLLPGHTDDEAALRLNVTPTAPFALDVAVDNGRNPSVGEYQGTLGAQVHNLSGHGESVYGRVSLTEGLREFSVNANAPLSARTRFEIGARQSTADVVEKPLNEVDVESKFLEIRIGLSRTLLRVLDRHADVKLVFERRRSKTFLADMPQGFAPGVNDGKSSVSVMRLIGDYVGRGDRSVTALRGTLSAGLDAFGVTRNDEAPDGRFVTLAGQVQHLRRLGHGGAELVLRGGGQLALDPLLPLEKYAIGGANTVRGYRENQRVRDSGVFGSAELRYPVLDSEHGLGELKLAAFVDAGHAVNKQRAGDTSGTLRSAGLGLRFSPNSQLDAELYFARTFDEVEGRGSTQDAGVHFRLEFHPLR